MVDKKQRIGERIKAASEEGGLSPIDMADRAGVSHTTVYRWINGESEPRRNALAAFAEANGIALQWLKTGEGPMREGGAGQADPDYAYFYAESDHALIPLVRVAAGAGNGREPFEEEIDAYMAIDRVQLRRELGADPARLVLMTVSGDSMMPTLHPGDRILVLRYQGEPIMDGGVYVLRRAWEGVMVKRVYWTEERHLRLIGDNDGGQVPVIHIEPGGEAEWTVIGKVVRVEKNL